MTGINRIYGEIVMKQSRLSRFLFACAIAISSVTINADKGDQDNTDRFVSQSSQSYSSPVRNSHDIHAQADNTAGGLLDVGLLISYGVIGYALLRKANTRQ